MDDDATFEVQSDYEVPLLHLLARLPGGQGKTGEVCRRFEAEYGHRVPREHYETKVGKEPKWRNNVRWCRKYLVERSAGDAPAHGVWRMTDTGRRWLENNPSATRIPGSASSLVRKRRPIPIPRSTTSGHRPDKRASVSGIALEQLEQTRRSMPADQFRQVWGSLYDQLLAEERTKTVTQISQAELGRRTRRWLDDVHAFLSGKNATHPSSEVICDWIQFCYALELHREAAALLPYVDESAIEASTYRRARRIAEVSRGNLVD